MVKQSASREKPHLGCKSYKFGKFSSMFVDFHPKLVPEDVSRPIPF